MVRPVRLIALLRAGGGALRKAPIAVGAGALVGVVSGVGLAPDRRPLLIAFCAFIGLAIYACIMPLELLAGGALDRLPPGAQRPVRGGLYFVAGVAGYFLAASLARPLFGLRANLSGPELPVVLVIAGAVATLSGLLIKGFGSLQTRLRTSAARLHEAEFAEKELELARDVQRRLLPAGDLDGPGYRIAARNLPARFVAGDFYDVFPSAGGLGIVVVDVSGKGMAASLVMASVKAMLPLLATGRSPRDTLQALNRRLVEELARREFVALALLRFDPASGEVELANAGLPDPYRLTPAGAVAVVVPGPRLPLGLRDGVLYETVRLRLGPGERLLLFTDGLPEAPLASGEPLGYEALVATLRPPDGPPDVWLDGWLADLQRRTLSPLADDWTALLLERRA